ncbi:MAG: aminotransferase class I/II-fold pyridoxal phosphate-dependent enzyme [Vulcanimicrobiaceae bacterium]
MAEPNALVALLPETVPFVGPEQRMRELGLRECLRLGANESPFGCSPIAVAAMRDALESVWCYGDPQSYALREALVRKHGVAMESLLVGAGIDDVMGLVVRAFTAPGDVVVTTLGTYPTLEYHVNGYGSRAVRASYRPDGRVDLDALLDLARKHEAKLLYLANPDNPSGTFATNDDIRRLIDALPAATLLMLDEAYADFIPSHPNDAGLDDRVVRLRTFSKGYGLAGARIGYVLATPRHISTMQKIRLQYGVNRLAQVGALAALGDTAFLQSVVDETAQGRRDYEMLASRLGMATIPSSTNFLLLDCRTEQRAQHILDALMRRGVWIRKPGAPPLHRYIRATVGTKAMRAAFADALESVLLEVAA